MSETNLAVKPGDIENRRILDLWAARMKSRLMAVNVMMPLVDLSWEGDLSKSKTVWVRAGRRNPGRGMQDWDNLAYRDVAPDRDVDKESFDVADGEYFAFEVDDLSRANADVAVMDKCMRRAIVAINATVESKILAAYTNVPSANRIDGGDLPVGTLHALFTRAHDIQTRNGVPEDPLSRWAVVDPDTTGLLLQDNAFARAAEMPDAIVQHADIGGDRVLRTAAEAPGFVGVMADYAVYESPHVANSSDSKFLLFGDKSAIHYVSQVVDMELLQMRTTFANAIRGLLSHDTYVSSSGARRLVYIKAKA